MQWKDWLAVVLTSGVLGLSIANEIQVAFCVVAFILVWERETEKPCALHLLVCGAGDHLVRVASRTND